MVQTRHQLAIDQAEEVEDQHRQGRDQRKTKSGDGEQKSHMKIENPVERMTQVSIKMILGIIGLVLDFIACFFLLLLGFFTKEMF